MSLVPKKVFFVSGKGYHKSKLAAFEQALRDAGIEKYNLVRVSSILPPYCIEVQKDDGLNELSPGQILYCVLSREESNEINSTVTASIGVALPADKGHYGYLSEYHDTGKKPEEVGEIAEDMAAEMLATTLGVSFDPDSNYDEKREVFKMGGKIVETKNVTSHANVKDKNEWACAIAAAIFII